MSANAGGYNQHIIIAIPSSLVRTLLTSYPGKHAPLLFVNQLNEVHPYLRVGTGLKKNAHVEHTEGALLLWRSHIMHGYEENMEDNRMTISFNVMPTTIKSDGGNYGFKITRI